MFQRLLRYENYIILFTKPGKNANELRNKVYKFLAEKRLNVKQAKTKLVKSTDSFDFLGLPFKLKATSNKFVSYPPKDNPLKMTSKTKQ